MVFDYKTFDPTKQNAIIEASAGTGKTFSVQEIVKKLVFNDKYNKAQDAYKEEIANDNLKKVLIVTFTEKATGELKDRIRKELEAELENRKEANLDSTSLSVNFDINSFNIFTIHSFCQNSIKEFCVDANLPIGLSVITNERYYLNNFIDKYIREGNIYLEIDDFISRDIKINIDSLKDRFIDVIGNYNIDDNIISLKYLENKSFKEYYNTNPLFKNHCDNLKNSSNAFSKAYYNYLTTVTDFSDLIKEINYNDSFTFDNPILDATYSYLKSVKGKPQKNTGFKGKTFTEMLDFDRLNGNILNDNYNKLIASTDFRAILFKLALESKSGNNKIDYIQKHNVLDPLLSLNQVDSDAIEYISNISASTLKKDDSPDKYLVVKYIKDLYNKWQDEKLKNKQQSFNDMIQSVRERISTNPNFKKALQEKYDFAIIDEFQDTNQLQFDIFKSIFMEDNNHRIIVVGDPKQSIYQFQGADLNVYEEAKTEMQGNTLVKGELYELKTNWRSTQNIIKSCNDFFKDDYFSRNIKGATYCIPFTPSDYSGCGREVSYLGKPIDAFWVGGRENTETKEFESVDPDIYSEQIVKQIIDFCSYIPGTKQTKLQIRTKNEKDEKGNIIPQPFRNVTFSDFTILYKVRSEAEHIERVLNRCGVPFIKFKDKRLFSSKECAHFIALLEAVDAIDFTGNNRGLFKKALFTDFFNLSLSQIRDEKYNRDDNDEMNLLLSWREIAKERKWENLVDHIFEDSNITKRLCTTDKIQSLTIYRQLADYIISFLYDNNTIIDLINNLKSSSVGSTEDSEEGTVEVGVDLNSVKLMTIHASKGLQFPIVCSIAGHKDKYTKSMSYIYHDKSKRKLSFESKESDTDDQLEFKRLIYVAYTRAEYLMLIPFYSSANNNKFGTILTKDTEKYINHTKDYVKLYCDEIKYKEYNSLKTQVNEILKVNNSSAKTNNKTKVEQEKVLSELRSTSFNKRSHKYSYSDLAHGDDKTDNPLDSGETPLKNDEDNDEISISDFDRDALPVKGIYKEIEPNEIPANFPKGKEIGSALHKIFENADFTDYKSRGVNDSKLEAIIKKAFKEFKLKEPESNSDTMKYVIEMVYSVLNSNLKVINGSKEIACEPFKLSSISKMNKKEEVDFNFNIFKNRQLYEYFNGSIDLLFRRKYDGGEYYSILDWKSDSLNETDLKNYYEFDYLKAHTTKHYAIQRVLYSYSLIKWLNKKYKETDLEITFNKHFGGVYYVYIRGCSENTGNGIYSQTWKKFKDLEDAYKEIVSSLIIKDETNILKLGGLKDDDIL